jgi:hypothetical protein
MTPPPPPPPQAAHSTTKSIATASPIQRRCWELRTHLPNNSSPNNHRNHDAMTGIPKLGGAEGGPERGRAALRFVVVTFIVTDAGLVPSGVTEEGDTEQVAADGAPMHERLID